MGRTPKFRQLTPQEQALIIHRLCPCCGVDPESEPLPLCCDNMELGDIGAGYVLYFKLCILFGFIMLVFSVINAIKLIANLKGGYCISDTSKTVNPYLGLGYVVCNLDWITIHSIANYGVMNVDGAEKDWILVYFLVYWLALSFCRAYLTRTNKTIDNVNDTPSDWTIMVKGLPIDEPVEQIKANFETFGALGKMVCKIKKISLAYNCEEYNDLFEKVTKRKREMKLLQVKETPQAIDRMKKRLESDPNRKKDEKLDFVKFKPDKKDYSPEFLKSFEEISEESRKVTFLLITAQ